MNGLPKATRSAPSLSAGLRQRLVVAVVDHPRASPAGLPVGRLQCRVVERPIGKFPRAAGGAFDHMDIGQLQRRELTQHVLEQRLRIGVDHIVGRRYRRQPDAHPPATDCVGHRLRHLDQQPCAVLDRAAIRIDALVAAGLQKLVDQITIGRMDLDAVEPALVDCRQRSAPKVVDDAGNLVTAQCTRHRRLDEGRNAVLDQHGLGLRCDRRRRYRRAAARLQVGVRDPADVPQLRDDLATIGMHRVGDALPCFQLLGGVQARHIGIALALVADGRCLGDQQAGSGPLPVIGDAQIGGNGAR